MLEALLRGPDDVLLLDEPDNYLDVPGKRWLEKQLRATPKTVLLVSHDRELLARGADRIVTLETGAAGSTAWVHGGSFATYHQARADRMDRLDELRRRWDEQHAKIKALVAALKVKATASDEFASRYRAAQTRLAKFEEAGPPEERPPEQDLQLRLRGARTGKRAVIAEHLELTGLMKPFDLEVWFGDRVAVLGSNGSGKSHFLRLLARGGTDPDARLGHVTSAGAKLEPVAHTGRGILGARVVPGWFAQTHRHPEFVGRTLLELLHRGDENRPGMPRDAASSALDRYGLVGQAQQSFETLSGGQQARFQILLLELSGTTLLLLDEPTDNLDLASAEALEVAPWRASRARCSPSRTTAGSRARSTGSSCSAPTVRCTSPTSRCGTRSGSSGRGRAVRHSQNRRSATDSDCHGLRRPIPVRSSDSAAGCD